MRTNSECNFGAKLAEIAAVLAPGALVLAVKSGAQAAVGSLAVAAQDVALVQRNCK